MSKCLSLDKLTNISSHSENFSSGCSSLKTIYGLNNVNELTCRK